MTVAPSDLQVHFASLQAFLQRWGARQAEILEVARLEHIRGTSINTPVSNFAHSAKGGASEANVLTNEVAEQQENLGSTPSTKTMLTRERSFQKEHVLKNLFSRSASKICLSPSLPSCDSALAGFKRKTKKKGLNKSDVPSGYHSQLFEGVCAVVIMVNAVMIGVTSDYSMTHVGEPSPTAFVALELFFTCFYITEIALRIRIEGLEYFRDRDKWQWNWFDLALVVQSIWDQVQQFIIGTGGISNLSFLRLLRLTKMMKLLRMVRLLRSFRELRLMLCSIFGCLKSLVWAFILVFSVTYMFSIVFLQGCVSYLESEGESAPESIRREIRKYWSSTFRCMVTLYAGVMGGHDWHELIEIFGEVGWALYTLFIVYISLFVFVISNTICSVFLEATISNADRDNSIIIQTQLEKKSDYIEKVQVFFDEMDDDGNGEIALEEFVNNLQSPALHAFANSLDLEVSDAQHFFKILSEQGKRPVDVETFVTGCIKLRGPAKSMDLMGLMRNHQKSTMALLNELQTTQTRLDDVLTNISMAYGSFGKSEGIGGLVDL